MHRRGSPPASPLDAPDQRQLGAVLDLLRETLGDAVIGAWLYGSAVSGGLRPASDLDVLALSRRRTTAEEKRRIVEGLLRISGRRARGGPARSIELSIVAEADVRPWRYPPRLDFQYGDWLTGAFARGEPEPWTNPNPDLAVLLTSVRGASRTLVGPDARDRFDPVPRGDLVRAMTDEVPSLLGDLEGDTRNVVLTLARMWVTLATGEIRRKDQAADWALERLPVADRPALAHARAIYLGETAEDWSGLEAAIARLVDRLVREIRRLAADR
jgi:predicted nucleotidyltransferase